MENKILMRLIARRPFVPDDIEDMCHTYYFLVTLQEELDKYFKEKEENMSTS